MAGCDAIGWLVCSAETFVEVNARKDIITLKGHLIKIATILIVIINPKDKTIIRTLFIFTQQDFNQPCKVTLRRCLHTLRNIHPTNVQQVNNSFNYSK